MKDLGTLGGRSSEAGAISGRGDIVGTSFTASGTEHAFLFSHGVMMDLGTLGGDRSQAAAINADGTIVGSAETPTHRNVAFVYSGGVMRELDTLVASWDWKAFADPEHPKRAHVPLSLTSASAINDKGQILATTNDESCGRNAVFLLTSARAGPPEAERPSEPAAIQGAAPDQCTARAAMHGLTGKDAQVFSWTCQCQARADAKRLAGDERHSFLRDCLGDRPTPEAASQDPAGSTARAHACSVDHVEMAPHGLNVYFNPPTGAAALTLDETGGLAPRSKYRLEGHQVRSEADSNAVLPYLSLRVGDRVSSVVPGYGCRFTVDIDGKGRYLDMSAVIGDVPPRMREGHEILRP